MTASLTLGQYGPGGQCGPNSDPGDHYNTFGGSGDGSSYSNVSNGRFNGFSTNFIDDGQAILIAHAVLASLAFVLLFPAGSILIRLGSFRGLWLVHGLFQTFAYLVYTAAFGIGLWIVTKAAPDTLIGHYHPIIGIVVFFLIFFQPMLGYMHHVRYRKLHKRTLWSYGHLWIGRAAVTLGMINGGLGLLWGTQTGFYVPSTGQVVAYGVIAGGMWVLWLTASVLGERRRARARAKKTEAPTHKEQYA